MGWGTTIYNIAKLFVVQSCRGNTRCVKYQMCYEKLCGEVYQALHVLGKDGEPAVPKLKQHDFDGEFADSCLWWRVTCLMAYLPRS